MSQILEPISDNRSVPERTYEKLLELIVEGRFPDSKLPPEIELAARLGVSRTALREALHKLELENYIVRRRQIGTMIVANRPKMEGGLERLNSVTGIITSAGMKPGTATQTLRCEKANTLVAQQLGIDPGTEVAVLERVRTADGTPFCYDTSFIKTEYFTGGDLEKLDESLFAFLSQEKGQTIINAVAHIHPAIADCVLSNKLEVPKDHLLTLLEQTHYTVERALWYSRAFYRSDLIAFHIVRNA